MLREEALVAGAPHAWSQALPALDRLDGILRRRPFLVGDAFTLADAAVYHPLWFAKQAGELFEAVRARPGLSAWYARIEAFGPGDAKPMAAAEALAVAREAEPSDVDAGADAHVPGLAVGDAVAITADDYGREQTCGTLVKLASEEIIVRRRDPLVGEVAVHYPRVGYRITRQ
jgi:hypothetical protein